MIDARSHAEEPLGNMPEEARRLMAEIGPRWGRDGRRYRDAVLEVYAPLLARSPKDGVTVSRERRYGSHARHVLDVFVPDGAARAPVVIFVHGGGLIRGERNIGHGVYDNVLYWFARHGCLGVNVEYRLAPEATYPCGGLDVAAAFDWTARHAAKLGGDPGRIFLLGHSAGATHVASCVLDPQVPKPGPGFAGMVLLSGRLRADALPENPNAAGVRAYFGEDERLYDARSPLTYAAGCRAPVMIAVAEFENPLLDVYGAEFFWRVSAARGRAPRFVRLGGHNHLSLVAHFNTGEERLGREIMSFISEGR